MNRIDRFTQVLLSALVLGIWCLAFQPVISARLSTPEKKAPTVAVRYKMVLEDRTNLGNGSSVKRVNEFAAQGYRVKGMGGLSGSENTGPDFMVILMEK